MAPDESEDEEEEIQGGKDEPQGESPYEFEDRFKNLLGVMGLSSLGGGRTFTLGGHQIDACGGVGDTLIVFDCTIKKGSKAAPKQLTLKIEAWRGKYDTLVKGAQTHPEYSHFKHVVVAIAANASIAKSDLDYGGEAEPRIRILNRQHIEYLTEIANDIGPYSRFRLASILGIDLVRAPTQVPAIRVSDRGKTLYLFAADAAELAELAFVPQAEIGFKYFYQRLIKKSKLRAIEEYVRESARPFPNSVILATKSEPPFEPTNKDVAIDATTRIANGILHLPEQFGACWVVDGQHRIYGSALSGSPVSLPVALLPATDLEKARYFLDINSNQTKIDPNLKWDLAAELFPDEVEGKISRTVQLLDESEGPLRGRIKIPHKGVGTGRPVKLSGLCDAIYRHRLYDTQQYKWQADEFVAELGHDLGLWFAQVDAEVKDRVFKSVFLFDNSGLSVLTILFKRIAKRIETRRPPLAALNEYARALSMWTRKYDEHEVGSLAKRCSSEAGRSEVANLAVSAMNELLPLAAKLELSAEVTQLTAEVVRFEAELRQKFSDEFGKRVGPMWLKQANLGQPGVAPDTPDRLGLGHMKTILQREPFAAIAKPWFQQAGLKPELGLHLLEYISGYRNATLHGKVQEAEQFEPKLVESGLRMLRRCFGLSPR